MSDYKVSEKVVVLSAPVKDLGPEWRAATIEHEIARCKDILRNPRATDFDRNVATARLAEYRVSQ